MDREPRVPRLRVTTLPGQQRAASVMLDLRAALGASGVANAATMSQSEVIQAATAFLTAAGSKEGAKTGAELDAKTESSAV